MTVLGLDCAGKTAGVALCRDGELFYESRLCAGDMLVLYSRHGA